MSYEIGSGGPVSDTDHEARETLRRMWTDRGNVLRQLEDALYVALPYVEDAEGQEGFKRSTVAKHIRQIRAALKAADAA